MFIWPLQRLPCFALALLLAGCLAQLATGDARPATAPANRIETLPAARGGQDVVGSRMPSPPKFSRLLTPEGEKPGAATPARATLYRWWTDGCPFCAKTLPAVETLRKAYGEKGLRVVAVYHPKPPREVSDEQIRKFAERLGYHGEIAVDTEWSVLKEVYLSKGDRRATSISLLVGADGVIRFVHPGTEYFPSSKPEDAQQDADYKLLEKAIAALLAERH